MPAIRSIRLLVTAVAIVAGGGMVPLLSAAGAPATSHVVDTATADTWAPARPPRIATRAGRTATTTQVRPTTTTTAAPATTVPTSRSVRPRRTASTSTTAAPVQPVTTTPPATIAPPPPPPATTTTTAPQGQYKITRFNADGSAVRWNPCKQIRLVINLQDAPSFARAELTVAIRNIEAASGLDLVDAGTTTERPNRRVWRNDPRYGPGYAPILVSFATAAEFAFGSATASGYGQVGTAPEPSGNLQIVTGQVVLRPDHGWTQGTQSANPLSLMLQHELGHVLGLGHVSPSNEIMSTAGNGSARTWGPGDLRGLAAVGRPAGCLPDLS